MFIKFIVKYYYTVRLITGARNYTMSYILTYTESFDAKHNLD